MPSIATSSSPRARAACRRRRTSVSTRPPSRRRTKLLRTLYLSLDPYMRELMNEVGPTYAPSVRLGEPMAGGTVNRVVASTHPQFRTDDLVLGNAGWQD